MSTRYINIVWNGDNSLPSYFGDCTPQGILLLPETTATIVVTLTAADGDQALITSFVPLAGAEFIRLSSTPNVPGQAIGLGMITVDFAGALGGQLVFSLTATIGGVSQPIPDPTVINVDPPTTVARGDAGARSQEKLPANVHRAA
jgi:hypothetical protein